MPFINRFSFIFFSLIFGDPRGSVEIKQVKDQILIEAVRYEDLESIKRTLNAWLQTRNESDHCDLSPLPQNRDSSSGKFVADITHCLPARLRKHLNTNPEHSGPNCWNSALNLAGILPALRLSPADEMAFYMRSPLCRPLQNNETRNSGDIGAIRQFDESGTKEVHGFIYISDNLAFSKDNYSFLTSYELISLDNLLDFWSVPKKNNCRTNQFETSSCGRATTYFRCSSLEEYFSQHTDIPRDAIKLFEDLAVIERALELEALEGLELTLATEGNIRSVAKAVASFLSQNQGEGTTSLSWNRDHNFLLGALDLRLEAIAFQLKIRHNDSLATEVSTIAAPFEKLPAEILKTQD